MGCFSSKPGRADEERAAASYKKYRTSGNPHDFEAALVHYRAAAHAHASLPDSYADIARTLAGIIWDYYQANGKPKEKLDEVIYLFGKVFDIWKGREKKPTTYPVLLLNLGDAYCELFYMQPEDDKPFYKSIEYYNQARVYEEKKAEATMMFGTVLCKRCEVQGHDRRLSEGIDHLEKAYTPLHGQPLAATCAFNLASAYLYRSTRVKDTGLANNTTKSTDDIDHAIKSFQAANTLYPSTDPQQGMSMYKLSQAFLQRYNVTRQASDLKDAGRHATSAKEIVPTDLYPELDRMLAFVKAGGLQKWVSSHDRRVPIVQLHGSSSGQSLSNSVQRQGQGSSRQVSRSTIRPAVSVTPEETERTAVAAQARGHANSWNESDGRAQNLTQSSVGTASIGRTPISPTFSSNSTQETSAPPSTNDLPNNITSPGNVPAITISPPTPKPVSIIPQSTHSRERDARQTVPGEYPESSVNTAEANIRKRRGAPGSSVGVSSQ